VAFAESQLAADRFQVITLEGNPMPLTVEINRRRSLAALSALGLVLAGCAAPPPPPPPPPPEPEVSNRLRFEDSPEGARAILPDDILFEFGKSDLMPAAGPVLDLLKPAFDKARGDIVIEGYTDSVGSDAFNAKLSLARATEVRNALVARQVPPNRIQVRGLGKGGTRRAPEVTDADRARNRRAEILFQGETIDSLGGRQIENLAKELAREQQRAAGR
jgi:outer membrane protein OmpA-like peptidoglycan-associated protein